MPKPPETTSLNSDATNPAAAALPASARVRVAARCVGRARAQHDSCRRHLCFWLVRAVSVFNYWFDGLTALAAIVAAMIPRALRETQSKKDHATLVGNIVRGVFVWLLLVGVVGLPYWIVLIPLHDLLLGNELRRTARAFSGALVHFRLARSQSFLEGVPHGLRHYA